MARIQKNRGLKPISPKTARRLMARRPPSSCAPSNVAHQPPATRFDPGFAILRAIKRRASVARTRLDTHACRPPPPKVSPRVGGLYSLFERLHDLFAKALQGTVTGRVLQKENEAFH